MTESIPNKWSVRPSVIGRCEIRLVTISNENSDAAHLAVVTLYKYSSTQYYLMRERPTLNVATTFNM